MSAGCVYHKFSNVSALVHLLYRATVWNTFEHLCWSFFTPGVSRCVCCMVLSSICAWRVCVWSRFAAYRYGVYGVYGVFGVYAVEPVFGTDVKVFITGDSKGISRFVFQRCLRSGMEAPGC